MVLTVYIVNIKNKASLPEFTLCLNPHFPLLDKCLRECACLFYICVCVCKNTDSAGCIHLKLAAKSVM